MVAEEQRRVIRLRDEIGPILANRDQGDTIFRTLHDSMGNGRERLVVDFSGVEVVTSAFADESLGKLLDCWGPESFKGRIQVVGLDRNNGAIVALVLRRRRPTK